MDEIKFSCMLEEEMMKRFWLIVLPVVAISLFASLAYTKPQPDREQHALDAVLAGPGGYRLGVVLSEISPHLRDDLKIDSGVMIEEVMPDSPAKKAGIQDGDIILKIDGKPVESASDIRQALRSMDSAKAVQLDILRDGKPVNVSVTPEKRDFPRMRFAMGNYLGVDLQELDADLASYFQTKPGSGVLITRVEADSPAEKAGLKSGDIVTEFNGRKVTTSEQLRDALSDIKEGSSVSMTILRHGKEQKLNVTPEQIQRHSMIREMVLPKVEELRNLQNSPEFRESMENLRQDMEKLKSQLKLRDEDLRKMKEDVQTEMQKFRDELKQYRKSD
jgi:membrane-associated protease RseP (regulator of RpoE activity)